MTQQTGGIALDEYRKFDFKALFFYLLKKLWIVVLAAVVFRLLPFISQNL